MIKKCIVVVLDDGQEKIFETEAHFVKVIVIHKGPEILCDRQLLNTQVPAERIHKVVVDGQVAYFNKLTQPH